MYSDSEESSDDDSVEDQIRYIKENDSFFTDWSCTGADDVIQSFTNEEWEQLGRDISNNTYLKSIGFSKYALSDDEMSFFFRGLAGSSSLQELSLRYNAFSVSGARSMVPFLQHATKLRKLDIYSNDVLRSEGFNVLLRALRDSPIKYLYCDNCGIETIKIDDNTFPKRLKGLSLDGNKISTSVCWEIAKLLRRGDSVLTRLSLNGNDIGDEDVAILVDALQNNTTLKELSMSSNNGISIKGRIELLKLLNDLSSVEATHQSNHTLERVNTYNSKASSKEAYVQNLIDIATSVNKDRGSLDTADAGKTKVITTQLHSEARALLAELQGVSHSLYSEINPLLLPEVLSLVRQNYGLQELYAALKLSIATLNSIVDTKQRIKQNASHYVARVEALRAELAYCMGRSEEMNENLAQIEAAEGSKVRTKSDDMDASRPSKRSRT